MKVVVYGNSCQALIFGSLYEKIGAEVLHYVSEKRHLKYDRTERIKVQLNHFYPDDGKKFVNVGSTEDMYTPKFTSELDSSIDLIIFSGCYDQVITSIKQLSSSASQLPRTRYLIHVRNWRSVEYLETIVGSNSAMWVTPFIDGFFDTDEEDESRTNSRTIKGMFIRYAGAYFAKAKFLEDKSAWQQQVAEFLEMDLFETRDLIELHRAIISIYTPIVLFVKFHLSNYLKGDKKGLEELYDYYKNTQPTLRTWVKEEGSQGALKNFDLYESIKPFKNKEIEGYVKKIRTNLDNSILGTIIHSTLRNKYSEDEAIDLATEMLRWFKIRGAGINGLYKLFRNTRVVWEDVLIEKDKKEDSVPTLELDNTLLKKDIKH